MTTTEILMLVFGSVGSGIVGKYSIVIIPLVMLCVLLLFAGSNEQMDEVLERIRQRNPMDTQIVILPGCNHGNGMYKQTEMYQTAIKEFLDKYMSV